MIEETAVRVEISAARFASQSIFDILRLTVQAMQDRNYGQQSLSALNRQERQLASVDVNDKTLRYVKRQLNQYSVDFSVTKDKDTGKINLWFKSQDIDRIQAALENCIVDLGKAQPQQSKVQEVCHHAKEQAAAENATRTAQPPERGERL